MALYLSKTDQKLLVTGLVQLLTYQVKSFQVAGYEAVLSSGSCAIDIRTQVSLPYSRTISIKVNDFINGFTRNVSTKNVTMVQQGIRDHVKNSIGTSYIEILNYLYDWIYNNCPHHITFSKMNSIMDFTNQGISIGRRDQLVHHKSLKDIMETVMEMLCHQYCTTEINVRFFKSLIQTVMKDIFPQHSPVSFFLNRHTDLLPEIILIIIEYLNWKFSPDQPLQTIKSSIL
jgi:hypothetical protein